MFLPRIQRLSLQPKLLTPKAQATLCFKHLTFVFVLANRRNCLVINQFLRTKGSTGTTKLIISFRKRVIWLVSLNNASYSVYCFLKSQCIFFISCFIANLMRSHCVYTRYYVTSPTGIVIRCGARRFRTKRVVHF